MKAIRVVLMKPVKGYPMVFYVPTEDQSLVENMMTAMDWGKRKRVFPYYLTIVEMTEKVIWPADNETFEEIMT